MPLPQRKLGCGHVYHIVLRWCEAYPRTAKPCPPNVTDWEFREHEQCGESSPPAVGREREREAEELLTRRPSAECRPRVKQPWEDMLPPATVNVVSRPYKVQ
jgi:hypothetical protein